MARKWPLEIATKAVGHPHDGPPAKPEHVTSWLFDQSEILPTCAINDHSQSIVPLDLVRSPRSRPPWRKRRRPVVFRGKIKAPSSEGQSLGPFVSSRYEGSEARPTYGCRAIPLRTAPDTAPVRISGPGWRSSSGSLVELRHASAAQKPGPCGFSSGTSRQRDPVATCLNHRSPASNELGVSIASATPLATCPCIQMTNLSRSRSEPKLLIVSHTNIGEARLDDPRASENDDEIWEPHCSFRTSSVKCVFGAASSSYLQQPEQRS